MPEFVNIHIHSKVNRFVDYQKAFNMMQHVRTIRRIFYNILQHKFNLCRESITIFMDSTMKIYKRSVQLAIMSMLLQGKSIFFLFFYTHFIIICRTTKVYVYKVELLLFLLSNMVYGMPMTRLIQKEEGRNFLPSFYVVVYCQFEDVYMLKYQFEATFLPLTTSKLDDIECLQSANSIKLNDVSWRKKSQGDTYKIK